MLLLSACDATFTQSFEVHVAAAGVPVSDALVVPLEGAHYREGQRPVRTGATGVASVHVAAFHHQPLGDPFAVHHPGQPLRVALGARTIDVDLAKTTEIHAKLSCGAASCDVTVPGVKGERCTPYWLQIAPGSTDAVADAGALLTPVDAGSGDVKLELPLPPGARAGWTTFAVVRCDSRVVVGEM